MTTQYFDGTSTKPYSTVPETYKASVDNRKIIDSANRGNAILLLNLKLKLFAKRPAVHLVIYVRLLTPKKQFYPL